MNAYLSSVVDRPGVAVKLFEAAAARGVNIFPAYGLADGTTGMMLVASDDEPGLEAVLSEVGLPWTSIELVVVEIENRPGSGAAQMRKLADAGVDLRVAVPIGMTAGRVQIAFGASDPALLKRALGS